MRVCNAVLQTYNASLRVCNATLHVCNVTLRACSDLLQTRNAALQACNALLEVCNEVLQTSNILLRACGTAFLLRRSGILLWQSLPEQQPKALSRHLNDIHSFHPMNTTAPPALPPGCRLVDTHCHLDMADYQADLAEVIAAANRCGVTKIITIGIDLASSRRAVELAAQHECVYAAVGIHPHDADKSGDETTFRQLSELAAAPKVVGFGEIGLDYAKNYSPKEAQLRVFECQLELAKELRLPLILHDRDAHEDCLRLLREKGPFPQGGVLHCFSGGQELAEQVLELGFYLSIPGIVTFPKAESLREVVRGLPSDRLLLETDGPFLAPVPFRGKCCRPEYLLHTAAAVAALRGVSLAELADQTSRNAEKLFALPA